MVKELALHLMQNENSAGHQTCRSNPVKIDDNANSDVSCIFEMTFTTSAYDLSLTHLLPNEIVITCWECIYSIVLRVISLISQF